MREGKAEEKEKHAEGKVTDESRTRPESMKAMRWENRVCDENGERCKDEHVCRRGREKRKKDRKMQTM